MPAKASSRTMQGSRPLSPASRLLHDHRCTDILWKTATPVGAWLAGEGVFKNDARLEAAFAGKPAPTRSPVCRYLVENGNPCRSLACRRRRLQERCKARGHLRRQAGSYTITGIPIFCGKRQPCRSRLAGEGVFKSDARLEAAFAVQAGSYRKSKAFQSSSATPLPAFERQQPLLGLEPTGKSGELP